MAELAPDHVERYAFAGELDSVSVAELVPHEAPAHTSLEGEPSNSTRTETLGHALPAVGPSMRSAAARPAGPLAGQVRA